MRHKLLLYGLSAAAVGIVIWACRRDRFGGDAPGSVEPTLTVSEARDFFEYQYSETLPYRTKLSADRPTGLMPGDFTPLWDKARIGANREMDGADVPIDPRFIFVAVFDRLNERGDTVRQRVDVTQKLVVKKWREADDYEAFCYIATIVPTPEHYARQKNIAKEFRYAGSKGDFSGFVFYQTLGGELVAATSYRAGNPTRHAYFPFITTANRDSVLQVLTSILETFHFQGGTSAAYMMDTEDDVEDWGLVTDPVIVRPNPKPDFPERPGGLPTEQPKDPIDWPDYGGNTGGGGGGGSSTSISVPRIQEKDCDGPAGENAANVQMIYNAFNSVGLQDFVHAKIGANNEWSAALNYDTRTGAYSLGNEKEGVVGHVSPSYSYGSTYTAALVHTHPLSEMPHSIADVAALIKINQRTGNTQTSFVAIKKNDGSSYIIYAIQIEDVNLANSFYSNYNESLQNQIHQESKKIFDQIYNVDKSMDESYAYSMGYLLDKYHTGVKILKCENGNQFKQKNTIIQNNTITRTTCK